MPQIIIGSSIISDYSAAYVIAEIGHNHGGDLSEAKRLIGAAADAGASAVKFQKRDNRRIFTEEMLNKPYVGRNSFGPTYGQHREALERHFTLDRSAPGSDHHFSQTPAEMAAMVQSLRSTRQALATPIKYRLEEETASLDKMAKTLVVNGNRAAGTVLDSSMVEAKTSGRQGIRPSSLMLVIGSTLMRDVHDGHVLTAADLMGGAQ